MSISQLQDLLRADLTEADKRILVSTTFSQIFTEGFTKQDLERSRTLGNAKSLLEFYELVRQVIDDYESRSEVTDEAKVIFTEEEPDVSAGHEAIVFSLVRRAPGSFSQGAPFEGTVKNQRPMFRGIEEDSSNPGYRTVSYGYWYDNAVRFTCWARTNKAANRRAEWFEDMMEEYSWWFKLQGVNRVLFLERQPDIVTEVGENRWYGRPIDYFVRTEKLRVYSEKQLEEILLKIAVVSGYNE